MDRMDRSMDMLLHRAAYINQHPHRQGVHAPTIDLTAIDHYWMNFLGCTKAQLYGEGATVICPQPAFEGLWAFARQGNWVVAAPPHWCHAIGREITDCFRPNTLPTPQAVQQLLRHFPEQQLYGPSFLFLHGAPIRPTLPAATIRPLTTSDAQAVAAFAAAATPTPIPWTLDEPTIWIKIFGLFVAERLVATCGVRLWGDLLAEVYVDTAPTARARGYGKAVTHAALAWIDRDTPYHAESVVELSNGASVQLLRRLGGTLYGHMVMSYADAAP